MSDPKLTMAYQAAARNLREFGYADITPDMIREAHEAWLAGRDLPHGVIGMFAKGYFEDHPELFGEKP
jgi:hypothetical protein